MYAERLRIATFLIATSVASAAGAADEQVFEPGSKHICVPAASGEDCRSSDGAPAATDEPKPAREPRLRSSSEIPDEAAPAVAADPVPATPPAAPRASGSGSRNVPHYLLAPEARASTPGEPAPAAAPARPRERPAESPPPAAAEPVTAAPAPTAPAPTPKPVEAAPPAAEAPAPGATRTSAPAEPVAATPAAQEHTPAAATPEPPVPEPVAELPAPRAVNPAADPPPPPIPAGTTLLGAAEFRRLGDSRYVIELASGSSRIAVEQEAAHQMTGEIYLLPLTRDGEPWFLAVRGDFDSVDAARAARNEALASGAARIGWPRRVGPLKQELGR